MAFLPETSSAYLARHLPVVSKRLATRASRRNLEQVMELNGREAGSTVFIIGSGPQLNDLRQDHVSALASRPTIGVNRTQYAVDLKYFLSAYPAEVILARARRSVRSTIVHLRPILEPPLVRNTLCIRRVHHKKGDYLEPSLRGPVPTLHTFKNVALAATHFALVLGAKRVVFAGVEQNSALHFYDVRPELRDRMITDIKQIRARSILTTDHPYATVDHLLEKLTTPPEVLATRTFYEDSHEERFREFFDQLKRQGLEVYATTPDSVVAAAGAEVVDLKEALGW